MGFRATNRIAGASLIVALASTTFLTAAHADYLIGTGQYPAPGSTNADFSSTGSMITTGGLTGTYTLNPTAYGSLWWGPQNIAASMNGNLTNYFTTAPVVVGNTATWSGTTTIATAGGGSQQIFTEFVATLVSGTTGGWVPEATDGISSGSLSPLDVVQVTGSTFKVNEQFLASSSGLVGSYVAFDSLYTALHIPPGGLEEHDVSGGFWYTSAVPEASTWAMMLLGFAGIGLTAYRSRSKRAFRFV